MVITVSSSLESHNLIGICCNFLDLIPVSLKAYLGTRMLEAQTLGLNTSLGQRNLYIETPLRHAFFGAF